MIVCRVRPAGGAYLEKSGGRRKRYTAVTLSTLKYTVHTHSQNVILSCSKKGLNGDRACAISELSLCFEKASHIQLWK
jgi:hypothetical protein